MSAPNPVPNMTPSKLGEILVEVGVISQAQLNQALTAAKGSEKDLPKRLIDLKFTTEEKIMKGIGIKIKVPYFTSLEGLYTGESANIIPEELARRLQVVPLFKIDGVATVAMVNPTDVFVIDTLARTTGGRIDPVVCMRSTIFDTINKLYGGFESSIRPMTQPPPEPPATSPNSGLVIEYSPSSMPPPTSFSAPGRTAPPGSKKPTSPNTTKPAWPAAASRKQPESNYSKTPRPAPATPARRPPEANFNKIMDDLRQRLPEQKMSQMDVIQRDIQRSSEDMPIVQLVDAIFLQAIEKKASDIHIEPSVDHTEVRFRIDGVLHPIMTMPKEFEAAVISRIKVMANLDITEVRQPQDGRVLTEVVDRPIDLRISTLPTIHGEKTVIRILDKGTMQFELIKLGFNQRSESLFKGAMEHPNGIILVTGPTGSGKSTTLYTGLTLLNSSERNIVTLEDPVEYQLPGINQVQVNIKSGLTFAKGLRSILRQDPDVIMVGEIRDLETAEIAIQAALTGHLVLSTLHTNDASSAITRLRYMRVEPFLISASVLLVIAQRLIRVLCPNCKEPFDPPPSMMEKLVKAAEPGGPTTLFQAKGCQACNQSGYKGRQGLFEIFWMSQSLREMAADPKTSLEEIKTAARAQGMRTLFEEGARAVFAGLTSAEEMMRVCTMED
ncbi:MAG: type II/IV secretion system protein [Elusimicrobiota bacterium]|jgi:type II secretory ATPase GspE/PulE/Tfp pilus assembly ATPase PilB-like protein